jgi:magnesium transporter
MSTTSSRKPSPRPRRTANRQVAEGVNLPTTKKDAVKPPGLPSPPAVVTEGGVKEKRARGAARCQLLKGGGTTEEVELSSVPRLVRSDRNLVWIDLSEYGEGDLRQVAEVLRLHPLTLKATLGDWERPRVDVFDDYFYMSVTVVRADQAKRKLVAAELNLVVGRNVLVTAHKLPLEFGEKILDRLKQGPEVATLHTAYALYIVLDELIEYYQGLFEHIDEEIEGAEERALTEQSDAFLADLLALKRYIFVLGRFAEQHRSVFAVLTRPDFTHVSGEDIIPYFKGLQEDLDQLIDRLSSARDSVTQAFDIYVSQVSHRTNALIKVLTLISTVVLPTTLIVGFFSTNFSTIQPLRSVAAFYLMLAALIITPIAILIFIRSRKLI